MKSINQLNAFLIIKTFLYCNITIHTKPVLIPAFFFFFIISHHFINDQFGKFPKTNEI